MRCRDYQVPHFIVLPQKGTNWDLNFNSMCCLDWFTQNTEELTLPFFMNLFCPYDWLKSLRSYPSSKLRVKNDKSAPIRKLVKRRCFLVLLMLLLSGNVHPNPGPGIKCLSTPSDFKARSGLGVIHLNVRSLLPKLDLVKIWAKSTDTDILVLSETWLTKSISDKDISIKGYNVFRCDRPRKGGGLAIYIKNRFQATLISSISLCKQFEFLALKLELLKGHFITVVGCYRPPSASSEALASLNNLLSTLDFNEILLTGDLNWDWLSPISDSFKSTCDSFNLTQLIDSPTRPNLKSPEKSSLLDLFLTNSPHKYSEIGVFANDLSDHCVIATVRQAKLPKTRPRIVLKRQFKHFCEQAFHHDLWHIDWTKISLINDVELAWKFFHDVFTNIINKHAPLRKFRVKGRDNPWFSSQLSTLLRERDVAWAKARSSKSEADWLTFRQLRNRFTSLVQKAKSDFYFSKTISNLNDPRKFWKVIKSSYGSVTTSELPTCIVTESCRVTDKAAILNSFNKHFISSGSLFESLHTHKESDNQRVFMSPPQKSLEQTFNLAPLDVVEVLRALKMLDPDKSAGPDKLEPYFLREAADFIAEPLTHIFNLTIANNEIPQVWKSAYVLPLLKGGDPSSLNNYRPISKLCILAKVLEKLISEQLKDFLDTHGLLSRHQSGFRKQHSTITATMKVVNDIIEALDCRKYCAALFLDLSKAFDTVDHALLTDNLHKIGLSEQAVHWFSNYLAGRTQCVQSAGFSSPFLPVFKGVPQGSVLGPLLFSIYVNNLCDNLSNADYHFYADDTVIYCSSPCVIQTLELLQSAFDVVQSHLTQLKLVLNADKTKYVLFTNGKRLPSDLPKLFTAQGVEIERVTSYKYLGIFIEENLTFKLHIDKLVTKLKLKLGFFFRNKSCFSLQVRKHLVLTTFLPLLDYGDLLFMNAPEQYLRKLDTVYHSALRFLTGCGNRVHHCTLYATANCPSLSVRRLSRWLTFVYKSLIGLVPSYLSLYMCKKQNQHALRSQDVLQLVVPRVRTELGKKGFKHAAPSAWNDLQKDCKLPGLITLGELKSILKDNETRSLGHCNCD